MSLNINHVRQFIVKPALEHIGLWSEAAENLVMGTGMQESTFMNLRQLARRDGRRGPARGLFQMEPNTYKSHLLWLNENPQYGDRVSELLPSHRAANADDLIANPLYAAAMCRIHYWRIPHKLPPVNSVSALAWYWKRYYNSMLGAGTVEEFVKNYVEMVRLERIKPA